MTHLVRDLPDIVLTVLSGATNIFALIAIFYLIRCLFDLDFLCSCEPQPAYHEVAFIVCPIFIIFLVAYLLKSSTPVVTGYKTWDEILYGLSTIVASTTFWISAVFLEGDWWLCISTKNVTEHQNISCKNRSDFTTEENIFFAQQRSYSHFLGLLVITVALILWAMLRLVIYCWRVGCKNQCSHSYEAFYDAALREATEKYLKEELTKMAELRAKNICNAHLSIIRQSVTLGHGENAADIDIWKKISLPNFYKDGATESESLGSKWFKMTEELKAALEAHPIKDATKTSVLQGITELLKQKEYLTTVARCSLTKERRDAHSAEDGSERETYADKGSSRGAQPGRIYAYGCNPDSQLQHPTERTPLFSAVSSI